MYRKKAKQTSDILNRDILNISKFKAISAQLQKRD